MAPVSKLGRELFLIVRISYVGRGLRHQLFFGPIPSDLRLGTLRFETICSLAAAYICDIM